ncbi:hypothetical protein B0J17DRAFT_423956 [Rhizoctonia solani]|nr:hypothetical protein B0J17DRAFT_423956 [Rhizoctonia solani]
MLDFVHPHILAVVVGLIFSNMMFFAVVGILFSRLKTTLLGTSLKLGLWIGGFTLEVCSHLWYPILHRVGYFPDLEPGTVKQPTIPTGSADDTNEKKDVNPLPLVGVNLSQRLDTITTIILGEGINGFAGTLTSILTAPGVGRLIGANVISAAFIIWFIAYLYFEGPTVLNPKGEGLRRLVWMVTYLPFLSSIFLLLVGIKNQFILTSTISTVDKTFVDFMALLGQEGFFNLANITNPAIPLNPVLKDFLFARGMIWFDEYHLLMDKANLENKTEWAGKVTAWVMRLSFTMIITSYKTFNKQADIPQEVELRINKYNEDDSLPIQDFALNVKGDRVIWSSTRF